MNVDNRVVAPRDRLDEYTTSRQNDCSAAVDTIPKNSAG